MSTIPQIALLIDADNVDCQILHTVMPKLLDRGSLPIRYLFANWRKKSRKEWDEIASLYALRGIQQFDPVVGKNATDIALSIAAMDLLHSGLYDTFAIVSGDGDFTPLAIRLREAGVKVLGFGKKAHASAFANACDSFEVIGEEAPAPVTPAAPVPAARAEQKAWPTELRERVISKVRQWFLEAYDILPKKDDGFVMLNQVGTYIRQQHESYDLKKLGYAKTTSFLKSFPEHFELGSNNTAYRVKAK